MNVRQTRRVIKISRLIFTDMGKPVGILSPGRPRSNASTKGLIMVQMLKRFGKDTSGATAIEYGLIAAGIAVAIIATVQALGTQLNTTFSSVSTAIK